jgi:hypothetical protein
VRRLVIAERERRARVRQRLDAVDRAIAGLMRHEHPYDPLGR